MKSIAEWISYRETNNASDRFLRFGHDTFTFSDLGHSVRRYMAGFKELGVKQGDRVGIMMPNHPEHIFVYLALSSIGATVIEFSIHFKRAGLELQLQDSDPDWFICETGFTVAAHDILASSPGPDRVIWSGAGFDNRQHISLPHLKQNGTEGFESACTELDRLQAVSFTSGTSGRPKGAMLSDRYFQIGAKNAGLLADVRADDVLFLWEPFYHVAGWMTVLMSLQHGVPIAMVARFSGSHCWDQVRETGATTLHYLGGVMNILLKQPERADDADNPVRVAWGAAAPLRSWRVFEDRFNVRVREGYGLSEAGNFTHLNLDGPIGSVGRPTDEFDCWIANGEGRPASPGTVGEIVIRPHDPRTVMQGYFRDAERTAEVKREGCVYSGDLGYVDEDGYYYYEGRKKDSLRRRGENVSAWEVERVINAHPAVEESAVIGVASEMGEQDIKVFVRMANGHQIDPLDLIRWCEKDLAYYQIPRFVAFVDDFPRGPTQRIKKSELPADLESWDLEQSGYEVSR